MSKAEALLASMSELAPDKAVSQVELTKRGIEQLLAAVKKDDAKGVREYLGELMDNVRLLLNYTGFHEVEVAVSKALHSVHFD